MKIVITIDVDGTNVIKPENIKVEQFEDEKEVRVDVSPYAVFFDESCSAWTKDPESNKYFLNAQQNYANELLRSRGHMFLNDIYDMLGFPRTKAGQVVGWIYDETNPIGDNYVDFGLLADRNHDFINGYESIVLLDFNVDGNIWDRM